MSPLKNPQSAGFLMGRCLQASPEFRARETLSHDYIEASRSGHVCRANHDLYVTPEAAKVFHHLKFSNAVKLAAQHAR